MNRSTEKAPFHDMVVIGGGVIGMTIALRLKKAGHEVALVEPDKPGMGASYGNAGVVADYATIPVGTPDVLRTLPDLLLNPESPLSVPPKAIPGLIPWLAQFLYQSLPRQSAVNVKALGLLVHDASRLWHELAQEIGALQHLRQRGCLYLYESKKAFEASSLDEKIRRDNGVHLEVLSAAQVRELEPKLKPFEGGGHYFPSASSIDDPGAVMNLLACTLRERGVIFHPTRALSIDAGGQNIRVLCETMILHACKVIIAAGAYSRALAKSVGENVPLDTERGYHLEYDMGNLPITRPVGFAKRGFYACPMAGRLRIAGTVELGGLHLPASPHRLKMLERNAKTLFPDLEKPVRTWLGFRPSLPNSLPVIRPARQNGNVILAFGHGHLGLTLAPATAIRVEALVHTNSREPEHLEDAHPVLD